MSEKATCHEWIEFSKQWAVAIGAENMPPFMAMLQYCPVCGTRLNSDGTTTERCDVVTPEAVRGMMLWKALVVSGSDANATWDDGSVDDALASCFDLGLITGNADLTESGRIILAALQQGHGLAVAEWLAERYAEQEATLDDCGECFVPGGKCTAKGITLEECTRNILRAALASVPAPAPVAGGRSDTALRERVAGLKTERDNKSERGEAKA